MISTAARCDVAIKRQSSDFKEETIMANFCTSCGAPLREGALFCTSCGAPVSGAGMANGVRNVVQQGAARTKEQIKQQLKQRFIENATVSAQPVQQAEPICPRCGTVATGSSKFCIKCGFSFVGAAAQTPGAAPAAQTVFPQPQENAASSPVPRRAQPKLRYVWTALFVLLWAGLLYLGWLWVPEAVRDARLPYVPAVSEEELTEEQVEEFKEIEAREASGELTEIDVDEETSLRHSGYAWLNGDSDGEGADAL